MTALKKIKKTFVFILMLPFWAYASSSPELAPASIQELLPTLEKEIEKTVKSQGIPGVALAIVSKDEVFYLKTFGVKRIGKKEPIEPTTLFQIASLSKPVNATMMAILQDKGKLSLTDPVNKVLPQFQSSQLSQELKICHLMSHSSGLPNNGFNEMIESFAPRENILARLQRTRPRFSPGQHFAYHNAMYSLIGDIISKTTGKPLSQSLKEELFTPLGMTRACVGLEPLLYSEDKAYPHVLNRRGKYITEQNYSKAYYAAPAAGGINASIQDMVPFLQLYLGKPSPIVSRKSLDELTTPFVKTPNSVMLYQAKKGKITNTHGGLGWQTMDFAHHKICYHQGHLKGFRNFMGFLPNDVGIIILTNGERKYALRFALKFFDLYTASKNKLHTRKSGKMKVVRLLR